MIDYGCDYDARGVVDAEWAKQSLLLIDGVSCVDAGVSVHCERVVQWEVNARVKVMRWSHYVGVVGDMSYVVNTRTNGCLRWVLSKQQTRRMIFRAPLIAIV